MGLLSPLNPAPRLRARAERRAADYLAANINPVARDFLRSFGVDISKLLRKDPRTLDPGAMPSYGPGREFSQIVDPPYDAARLQTIYEQHWVVRTCIDKLVREVTRQGWRFEPEFEVMCTRCGTEFENEPVSGTCPHCARSGAASAGTAIGKAFGEEDDEEAVAPVPGGPGSSLIYPDQQQIKEASEFLVNPNPTITFLDILKRFTKDLLVFDDAYMSEVRADGSRPLLPGQPKVEWWPEDARYLALVADAKGRLGGQTFCPEGEATKAPGAETTLYKLPAGSDCPTKDGGKLVEAGYVQRMGGTVSAAFSPSEVLHTNLFAVGSRLFGTPKIWALQTQITAMALIDAYQREAFDKAKTPNSVYLLKGVAEGALSRLLRQHREAKRENLAADLWIPVPNAGTADVSITKLPGMEAPLLSGSLGYSEWYFKTIAYTFGVDPASIGVETPGRLGGASQDVISKGVSPETIDDIQMQVSEAFDRFIKARWPKIMHFHFTLRTAHETEEREDWETKRLQMETARIAADMGLDVRIDEDGSPKISGEVDQEAIREEKAQEMEMRFGQVGDENRQKDVGGENGKPFGKALEGLHLFHKEGDGECTWVTIRGNAVCIAEATGFGRESVGRMRVIAPKTIDTFKRNLSFKPGRTKEEYERAADVLAKVVAAFYDHEKNLFVISPAMDGEPVDEVQRSQDDFLRRRADDPDVSEKDRRDSAKTLERIKSGRAERFIEAFRGRVQKAGLPKEDVKAFMVRHESGHALADFFEEDTGNDPTPGFVIIARDEGYEADLMILGDVAQEKFADFYAFWRAEPAEAERRFPRSSEWMRRIYERSGKR